MRADEERRRELAEHRLKLGSRSSRAYRLDDPDIAASLSGSLLHKLQAAGISDITKLEEADILALGLSEEELNELLNAIYLAKYLQASPALMRFLKETGQNPLTLWKLKYDDVNAMDLSDKLKEELFKHVLTQQRSFVANVEIPTARNIILKGWRDENLAFMPRHDARLVTKDFAAKEELNTYIDLLRAG